MSGFLRPEFLILVVIALLIFGPKKLPEMGSSIGKTIREFQKSMREVKEPEQPSAAVPPASTPAPTAQIAAPAPNAAATVTAEATAPAVTPAPAPTASAATTPTATTPTADPLPSVGTTVE